jgi:diguanylate cyclase (GGDEF)-like protein
MNPGPGDADRDELAELESVPADVAARIVRAMDRSPSTVVTLVDSDLSIRWISRSAGWITGTDPTSRKGADSLERIHPDDVVRLLHGLDQLRAARPTDTPTVPVVTPLRYRFQRFDGRWVVMEARIHNLLDDPLVEGMLVESRPVDAGLDGVGHVVDLLVAEAPLPDVLAACASLVPSMLGSTAVVALVDGGPVIGAPDGSPACELGADDRWWRGAVASGKVLAPADFTGFPRELADRARAGGFRTAWALPLTERSSAEVMGCVVVWVRLDVDLNIGVDENLRQARRLASLVIAEERRRHALRREAVTDPLTGLGNRSALRRRLDVVAGPVTLALVDLDDFKPINDTYGHAVGDSVLRVIGGRLSDAVRADDLVVRFGGDEFAVVFAQETSPEHASRLAERIVVALERPIALEDADTAVTVGASVGLATGPVDEVVHEADAALYEAKRNRGRRDPRAGGGPTGTG